MAMGELQVATGRIREGRLSIEQAPVLDPANHVLESAPMAYRDGAFDVATRRYAQLSQRRSIDWEGYSTSEQVLPPSAEQGSGSSPTR